MSRRATGRLALKTLAAAVLLSVGCAASAQDMLIRNATVHTAGAQGTLQGTDVLVGGGVIRAVGKGLAATPGAQVIDAQGRPLTPTLFGGISEIGLEEVSGEKATVGGCIGDAKNTEGLSGSQMVEVLGLDYDDKTYVTKKADGTFEPVQDVMFIETPLTKDMGAHAKITVDQSVMAHIVRMAACGWFGARQARDGPVFVEMFRCRVLRFGMSWKMYGRGGAPRPATPPVDQVSAS